MSKKVPFGTMPGNAKPASTLDDLVNSRREGPALAPVKTAPPAEPTKRISADLPVTVHQQLKVHCAQHNILIADFLRDLVLAQFKNKT